MNKKSIAIGRPSGDTVKLRGAGMDDVTSISYCALCCGNCFIRSGRIADLAQQIVHEFEIVEFAKWAEALSSLGSDMEACKYHRQRIDVLKGLERRHVELPDYPFGDERYSIGI